MIMKWLGCYEISSLSERGVRLMACVLGTAMSCLWFGVRGFGMVTQRIHIHYHYGNRAPKLQNHNTDDLGVPNSTMVVYMDPVGYTMSYHKTNTQ